ncbi:hypothetical protein HOD08_02590, partial [bacterium]|nr:hypothetical protein [bacterium]
MNFKKAVSFFVVVSVVMCFSNPGLLGDVATFNVVTGNLVKIAQQWKDVESLAMGQKIHDTKSRATYEATLKAVKEKVPVLEAWKVKYPVYEAWYKILAPFETTLTGAIAHVKSLESAPAASSSSSTGVAQKSSYSAVFLSQLVHGAKAAQGYTEDQILEQTSHRSTYDKLRAQLQKVVPDLKSAGWENGNAYNKKTYEMLEAFLKKLVGAFSAAGAVKTSNYSAAFLSQLVNTANNSAKYEVLQIQASTSSHAAYNKIHAQLQKVVPDLIAAGWETGNEYNKKTYVPLKKFLDQLDLVFPKNKKDLGLTVQPSSTQPPPPPPKQPEQKAKSLADQISDFEVLFQGKYSEDDVVKFGMFASDNKNEINADDDLANRVAALMKIVLGGDGGSRDVGSETSLSDWLTKFEAKFEGEFSDSDVTEFDEFIEKNLSALSESDDFLARVEALSQKLGGDGLVGEPLATVNFGSGVTSAEFSPDGKYVIAVGAGEGASGSSHRVYSVVPGTDSQGPALREIGTGYNHGKALRDATWSSDGQHVVVCGSASNNATSRVYSVIDGVLSQTDVGYYSASETFSVAWNPVHRWVAICHGDTRYGIYYFKDNYKLQVAYAKAGGDGAWRCVAWSPGGEYLAIAGSVRGGKTHKICRFDVKQNGRLGEKTEISSVNHGAELESVAWSPDGKFLAVAGISDSGGVTHRIYKVTDGVMEEVGSGYQHGSRLRSISWISNSMLVVGGENNEGISSRTYNVDENGILSEVEGAAYNAGEQVFATDCDPLGKYVICGGSNGELSIRGIHIPALFKSIFDEAIADLSLSDAEIVQNKTAIEQRVAAMQGRTEEIDFGKLPSWFQTKFSDTKNALHAKIASGFDGSLQPFDFNSISSGSEFFFKTERGFVAAVDETPKVFLDPKLIINQGSGAVKLVLYSGAAWWQTDKFLEKTSDGKLKFTGSANGIAFTPQKFGNFVVFKNSSGDDYMKFVSESEFVMGGTLIEAVKFELTTEDDLRLAAVKSILKDIKPTSLAGMKAAMASFLNAFELASNRKTAVDEIGNDLKTKVAEWMQAGWWWNPDVSGVYPAHYIKAFASEVKKLGASVGLVSEINQGYETGRITRMGSPLPDSQVLPTISTQVVTDGSGIDIVADTSGLAPAAGPAITFSFTSPGSVVIKIGQSYLEAVDGSLILQKDQNRFAPAAQVGITYETDTATGDVHVWLKSGGNYLAGKSDGYRSADAKLTFSEVSTAYSSKFKIVPVDLSTMAFKLMHVESGGYALLLPKLRGLYIRKDNGWGAFKALVEEAEATVFEASPRLIPEGVSVGETLQA